MNHFKKQLKEDVLEYFNWTEAEFDEKVKTCREIRKKAWEDTEPKTADEVNKFYQTCGEEFIANIVDFNLRENLHFPELSIFGDADTVLDYGSGVGTLAFHLASNGKKVTLCDLDTAPFIFAQWRFQKHDLPYEAIKIDRLFPLEKKYDAICCVDVIEHLVNPVEIVWMFHEHLNDNGVLYITNTDAKEDDVHPYHLIAYPKMFKKMIEVMGFGFLRQSIYRKVK